MRRARRVKQRRWRRRGGGRRTNWPDPIPDACPAPHSPDSIAKPHSRPPPTPPQNAAPGRAILENLEQARADRDEAEAQYRKAVLSALSDAETSLTRFGNQRKNLASSVQSRNGARQSAAYAAQRFSRGAVPLTTSLDAERAALAADQSVLEATGELDRAFIALQKSIGLGWE